MDSSQLNTQNVETVEIEEPSDKVQVLSDEKTCITRKHLYIIVGVLLVAAIALIGTLLGFTASSPDNSVNQDSLKLGVASTFPMFDTNNDGYIDHNEMSNWMSIQLATCKQNCKGHNGCDISCGTQTSGGGDPSTNGTTASALEVNGMISPCDFDGNGKLGMSEVQACVIQHWLSGQGVPGQSSAPKAVVQDTVTIDQCQVPDSDGITGNYINGRVGACRRADRLWCYAHFGCQDERHCQRSFIPAADQTTDTCCGGGDAANCTGCSCGATFSFVTTGSHPNVARYCHKLADFYCDHINTHVKCH